MSVSISSVVLDAIHAEARAAHPRECCGLLLGASGRDDVDALLPAANVAANPLTAFEIDPAILLAAHRAARAGGAAVLGCYHSHPQGSAEPSPTDAANAEPGGALWLIVSEPEDRVWRAVADGQVHERFDPVPFVVIPAR